MRTHARTAMTAVAAVALVAVTGGVGATTLQGEPDAPPAADLVERLVELERDLPPLPPDDVVFTEGETFAELTGDFTGARVAFETIVGEARQLFVEAAESDDPVAVAVASDARAILLLAHAYDQLAEYETYDLAFPVEAADDDGVSVGADEPYGLAETGLRILLDAHSRRLAAFEVLRDSATASPEQRDLFEARYAAEIEFEATQRPRIHRVLSLDTTEVVRVIDRFDTAAPGTEARARSMTVVCIDREAYVAGDVTVLGLPELLIGLADTPSIDCPDLPGAAVPGPEAP